MPASPDRTPSRALAPTTQTPQAADRDWLRRLTEDVLSLAYRTACDLVRIGQRLAEARARLKRRAFSAWVREALPWSRGHCYRLIAVAGSFGPYVSHAETERIEPTALYLLASPSVPPAAREFAAGIAAERKLTAAEAREILAAFRPSSAAEPTGRDVRAYEAAGRAVERAAGVTSEPPPREPSAAELAWAALERLAAVGGVVTVGVIAEHDDAPVYTVTAHRPGEAVRRAVRRSLADAVTAAAGCEPEKFCNQCSATKPVGEFGNNKDLADGRNRYCKKCERARLKEHKAGKRKPKPPPAA